MTEASEVEKGCYMGEDIAVSVCCITYNQLPYLKRAVQGFLSQKTTFPFEVLIHDDASTDGTIEYLRELAAEYPDTVRLFLEEKNRFDDLPLGGYIDGLMALEARGTYLALCEGDDYWTDPEKLQVQYDYMQEHPECSACAHAADIVQASTGEVIGEYGMPEGAHAITTEDVLQWGRVDLPPTASYFYRKDLVAGYVALWDEPTPVGDFPLEVYLAENGIIAYLDRKMSVYRYMTPGSHNARMRRIDANLAKSPAWLVMLRKLDEYTRGRYHDEFMELAKPHIMSSVVYQGKDKALADDFAKAAYARLSPQEVSQTRVKRALRKLGLSVGRPGGKLVVQRTGAK